MARNGQRALEIRGRLRSIRLRRFQSDFPGDAIGLSLEPSFFGCFESTLPEKLTMQ